MSTNKISDEQFVTVYGWMRTRLGLKTNALFLFALIYGYNYHTGSEFYGSIKYMQEWLGIGSDNTIRAALKLLCEEKHYILKRYEKIDTGIRVYYRINPDILPPKDGSINSLWEAAPAQALPKITEAAQSVAIISPSDFAKEASSCSCRVSNKNASTLQALQESTTDNSRVGTQNLQGGTSESTHNNNSNTNKDKEKEKNSINNAENPTVDFSKLLSTYDASTKGSFMHKALAYETFKTLKPAPWNFFDSDL